MKLSTRQKNSLDKINSNISSIATYAHSAYDLISKSSKIPENSIYQILLKRHINLLTGLGKIYKEYGEPHYTMLISIGLRAAMFDLLILYRLLRLEALNDEDKLKDFVQLLELDQLFFTLKYLANKEMPNEQRVAKLDHFKKGHEWAFKADQMDYQKPTKNFIRNNPKLPTVSSLLMWHKENSSPDYGQLGFMHDNYEYYSKIDHFGIVTNKLDELTPDMTFPRDMYSTYYICKGILNIIQRLSQNDEILGESKDKITAQQNAIAREIQSYSLL